MTTKLTKRDVVLLYILVVVVTVLAFGKFIALPGLDRAEALGSQLMEVQDQEMNMRMTISAVPNLENMVNELKADLDLKLEELYPLMDNVELDEFMSNMVYENGLMPRNLNISQADIKPINVYSKTEGLNMAQAESTMVYTASVTFGLYGSLESMMDFLSKAAEDKAMRVTDFAGFTLKNDPDKDNKDGYIHVTKTGEVESVMLFNMTIVLYMYDKEALIEEY